MVESESRPAAAGEILMSAGRDFLRSWRILATTDLAFKVLAFALLTPGTSWLLYWMRSGTSSRVVADVDIFRFLATTRVGVATILIGGSLIFAITALEVSCLMAVALAEADGVPLTARGALAFAAVRAGDVLRLTAHMIVRLLVIVVPFGAAAGLVYLTLLHEHDINFYLARHPPEFWITAAIAAVLGAALAAVLVGTIARWALALPLVIFEGVKPRNALAEGARRSRGRRWLGVAVLASWAVVAAALGTAASMLPRLAGRSAAAWFGGSIASLLAFVTVLALVWGVLLLAGAVINVSLFSLVLLRLYIHAGRSPEARRAVVEEFGRRTGARWRLSGHAWAGVAALTLLAAFGFALLALLATRSNRPVLVVAHRGASVEAPENTLAAFRLAGEEHADFVELDVQESKDGEVLVVHDSDLMKIGGSPMKIWENDAAALRSVDIGSHSGAQFSAERVPTLAEALAACKGKTHVVVELKSYGHDQHLAERVVAVVEAAGMQNDCIFMSLDHHMVRQMKQLRPTWRCGALVAKAIGDLTELGADFLAVEARMASGSFVRRAHRANQDVYVWTVDDPAWMIAEVGRGVDGLITNKPSLACDVLARRAEMSDAERFLVAVLVRLGARDESLEAENALRP